MTLSEKIRSTLSEDGRTQKWLSARTGIQIKTLNAYLTGKKKTISAEDYYSVCRALNKPYEYFLNQDTA